MAKVQISEAGATLIFW